MLNPHSAEAVPWRNPRRLTVLLFTMAPSFEPECGKTGRQYCPFDPGRSTRKLDREYPGRIAAAARLLDNDGLPERPRRETWATLLLGVY